MSKNGDWFREAREALMADDATTASTDDGCGCCRPEPKTENDVVRELVDRRNRIEERLARIEPALSGSSR